MGTPASSVLCSGLGGAGGGEMYQTWEGSLGEVTVSWDVDKEQELPGVPGSEKSICNVSKVGTVLVCAGNRVSVRELTEARDAQ